MEKDIFHPEKVRAHLSSCTSHLLTDKSQQVLHRLDRIETLEVEDRDILSNLSLLEKKRKRAAKIYQRTCGRVLSSDFISLLHLIIWTHLLDFKNASATSSSVVEVEIIYKAELAVGSKVKGLKKQISLYIRFSSVNRNQLIEEKLKLFLCLILFHCWNTVVFWDLKRRGGPAPNAN